MYKKILIPTDGAPVSTVAAHAGVAFAQLVSAEILSVFVAPEYQYSIYFEMVPPNYPNVEEYKASMSKAGEECFKEIKDAADKAGLRFSGMTVFADATAQAIVKVAEDNGCDLIFMGSHGRSGWGQLLLGSVTAKVLSMCQIPVLVYRAKQNAANNEKLAKQTADVT